MNQGLLQQLKQYPFAFAASIALHLVLLIIVGVSLNHTSTPKLPSKPIVKTVQAVVVDAAKVDAELKKLKTAEKRKKSKEESRTKRLQDEAKKAKAKRRKEEKRLANIKRKEEKRLADLKKKQKKLAKAKKAEKAKQAKLEKERKKKQKELADLEKKRQVEQQKLAAIEAKRKAEEDTARKIKEAKEAEVRRRAEAAELKRQMEEEERRNAEQNSRVQKLRMQYVQDIMNHVQRYWLKPSNIQKGWKCDVSVQQNALGDVTHVKMLNCVGSDGFKSSVERAVRKASPLPSPKDPKAFDRNIQFTFNPRI